MATTERDVLVGVFSERRAAEQAVADLRQAGFTHEQIGFVSQQSEVQIPAADAPGGDMPEGSVGPHGTGEDVSKTATTGAVVGGTIGGTLAAAAASLLITGIGPVLAGGVLAAALGGAAVGAAGGTLLGSLASMGVPEEEVQSYERDLQSGRILVTVRTDGRYGQAEAILQRYGALDRINPAVSPSAERTV